MKNDKQTLSEREDSSEPSFRPLFVIWAILSPFLGVALGVSIAFIQSSITHRSDAWGWGLMVYGMIGAGIGLVAALVFGVLALVAK